MERENERGGMKHETFAREERRGGDENGPFSDPALKIHAQRLF